MRHMQFLVLFLSLLLAATTHAEPFSPAVQVLYPKGRDHRAVWRAAMKPFREVGIRPRLVKLVPLKIPNAIGLGIDLYWQYLPLAQKYARPGVRTLVLVPPDPRNPWFSGVSDIGGPVSICIWTRPRTMSATCIAHELGHNFGAPHASEGLMVPTWPTKMYFAIESVANMVGKLGAEPR